MFDNCISQLKHDIQKYQDILNAIEQAQQKLPKFKVRGPGSKHEFYLNCIEDWKKQIEELEVTLLPSMKEFEEKYKNKHHLKELGF